MKKSVLYKWVASIVLVSTISVSTTSATAQRRSQENQKTSYADSKQSTRLRTVDLNNKNKKNTYSDRSNTKKYKSYSKQKAYSNQDTYRKGNSDRQRNLNAYHKERKGNQVSHAYRSYSSSGDRYKSNKYPKQVHPHSRYKHFYNDRGHNYYQHDRFGRVVLRFAVAPIIIRHNHGDYYYSYGEYYRFYPEVGYVRVEAPNSLYFSQLPDDCRWISHQGHEYYTNGELCFVRYRNGFKLVKNPIGIHLSIRF